MRRMLESIIITGFVFARNVVQEKNLQSGRSITMRRNELITYFRPIKVCSILDDGKYFLIDLGDVNFEDYFNYDFSGDVNDDKKI